MKYYEVTVTRIIPVKETINIDLLAEDDDEAKDVAFEVAGTFPEEMDLLVDRCTITKRTYEYDKVQIPSLELVRHEEDVPSA